jgi:hypothetical protein
MELGAADKVKITMPEGRTTRLAVVQRAMPSGTGTALLYRCPSCRRPRRYLYPYALFGVARGTAQSPVLANGGPPTGPLVPSVPYAVG